MRIALASRVFIDTNVIVYADDADAGDKRTLARRVIAEALDSGTGVISTQVLQEFFVVSTRRLGVAAEHVRDKIDHLHRFDVVQIGSDHIYAAIDIHRLNGTSFWDALILAAARAANCSTLYTEDLNHGQTISGVRIVSPFA